MEKKLERDVNSKMIAGVCAGLANYLSIDVTIIRAIFIISLVLHGSGIIPYIILWIVMPKKSIYNFGAPGFTPGVDYTVPSQSGPVDYSVPHNPFANAQYTPQPKKRSNAGMIVGVMLIAFGAFFLLDNFELLPNWDFGKLWPIVFVAMGALLLFSPKPQDPWEATSADNGNEPVTDEVTPGEIKTEDKPADIHPTE